MSEEKEPYESTPIPDPTEPDRSQEELFKEEMKVNLGGLLKNLWAFIKDVLNIKDEVDVPSSIVSIKKDIDFRGYNIWILVCSIIIASIGLNTNSTAVIIGAMLISPLMGPILGLGLGVGTNDMRTLIRSLKGYGIAVGVSVLASFVYFKLSPLKDATPELIARTSPTILDVVVASFGGLAGIIAGARSEKSNVVPGVAIATALMPPLCTTGYGLAVGNYSFFMGALYLFLLNSVFIFIPTVIAVRYLNFPKVEFIDPKWERKIKLGIAGFLLLVIIPSGFIFWDVIKESSFTQRSEAFITEHVKFKGTSIINQKIIFNDSIQSIEIFTMGEEIPKRVIDSLKGIMIGSGFDKETILDIHQPNYQTDNAALKGELSQELRVGIIEEMFEKNEERLKEKEIQIIALQAELDLLQKANIPFEDIREELKVEYKEIDKLAYAPSIETDMQQRMDTIPTFMVSWKEPITLMHRANQQAKLQEFLKVRLKLDTCRVIDF